MFVGRRLQGLKRACVKAALTLRLKWLQRQNRARMSSALTMLADGQLIASTGVTENNPRMVADGNEMVAQARAELDRMGIKP